MPLTPALRAHPYAVFSLTPTRRAAKRITPSQRSSSTNNLSLSDNDTILATPSR